MVTAVLEAMRALLSPQGLAAATALIFLAGLSEGAGTRGVVLLVNRITPAAFLLSLLASALLFLLSAALWVWGLWLAATGLFGVAVPLALFFIGVSAAYGPLLLGALALLPLVGPLIRQLLRLWSFAIALGALASLGLTLWQATLCALLGALLVAGAGWLLGEPAATLGGRLWATLTGRPRPLRRDELPRVVPGYGPAEETRQ
ncbi:MAG TPA: hypothetical protein PKD53_00935 [Chloroflexaceae bacterium]|nr:hypothetical protein [Chloroflexaceae bacterium]